MENYKNNHYKILGLPSGVEARKLSEEDIRKAYYQKALQLHPDKQPNNPNANKNFLLLRDSYKFLNDQRCRELLDAYILVTHYEQQEKQEQREQQEQPPPRRRRRRSKKKQPDKSSSADVSSEPPSSVDTSSEPPLEQPQPAVESPSVTPPLTLPSVPEEKVRFDVRWKMDEDSYLYNPEDLSKVFTDFGRVENNFDIKMRGPRTVGTVVAVNIPSSKVQDIANFVQKARLGRPSNPLLVLRIGVPCKSY